MATDPFLKSGALPAAPEESRTDPLLRSDARLPRKSSRGSNPELPDSSKQSSRRDLRKQSSLIKTHPAQPSDRSKHQEAKGKKSHDKKPRRVQPMNNDGHADAPAPPPPPSRPNHNKPEQNSPSLGHPPSSYHNGVDTPLPAKEKKPRGAGSKKKRDTSSGPREECVESSIRAKTRHSSTYNSEETKRPEDKKQSKDDERGKERKEKERNKDKKEKKSPRDRSNSSDAHVDFVAALEDVEKEMSRRDGSNSSGTYLDMYMDMTPKYADFETSPALPSEKPTDLLVRKRPEANKKSFRRPLSKSTNDAPQAPFEHFNGRTMASSREKEKDASLPPRSKSADIFGDLSDITPPRFLGNHSPISYERADSPMPLDLSALSRQARPHPDERIVRKSREDFAASDAYLQPTAIKDNCCNGSDSKKREPRKRSPHPARGFSDPSLAKKPAQQDNPSVKDSSHPDPSKSSQCQSSSNEHGTATNVPLSLDSLNVCRKNSKDSASGGNDPPAKSSHTPAATLPAVGSLDVQKLQTAEELRGLIDMMQVEFQKLRIAKVNAEMKAQKLETDLISSQQERDAEFVRLSEEKERWERLAHQEQVQAASLQAKCDGLERDNHEVKVQWINERNAIRGLEEQCGKLEVENRRLKKSLKQIQSGNGPKRSSEGGGDNDLAEADSSVDTASSVSAASTSDEGSPARDGGGARRFGTPPPGLPPFESILDAARRTPELRAPASWHAGKRTVKRGAGTMRGMPAPPLVGGALEGTRGPRAGSTPPLPRSRTRASRTSGGVLARKPSWGTCSTGRSSITTLRDSTISEATLREEEEEEEGRGEDDGGDVASLASLLSLASSKRGGSSLDGMVVLMEAMMEGEDCRGIVERSARKA